jgi:hypothetical protein
LKYLSIYTKSSTRLCFIISIFLTDIAFSTGPTLVELLNTNTSIEHTLLFEKKSGSAEAISRLRIHFLKSTDCQSGYAGLYDTLGYGPVFPLAPATLFSLNAYALYGAALFVFNKEELNELNSMLIRFISSPRQFAEFTGSCQDQQINCCVPIVCSHQTGTCLSKSNILSQPFRLNK